MTNELLRFVQEGVDRYASACATIARFQTEVEALLVATLEAHRDWGRFSPDRKGALGDHHRSVAEPSPWIGGYLGGRMGKTQVQVELGLWWGQPSARQVAIYADFSEGPKELQSFRYEPPAGSGFFTFSAYGRTTVARQVTSASDFHGELVQVLDEFIRVGGCKG